MCVRASACHYLSLVPEDTAQGTKGLGSLADSGVHLNHCAMVVLDNAANVQKKLCIFNAVVLPLLVLRVWRASGKGKPIEVRAWYETALTLPL